jgi:hypothetical protein
MKLLKLIQLHQLFILKEILLFIEFFNNHLFFLIKFLHHQDADRFMFFNQNGFHNHF